MGTDHARGVGDHEDWAKADQIGEDRDQSAEDRDRRAEAHDHASEARDERAEARDDRAEARERGAEGIDPGAAADRAGAMRDRQGGASDRAQAGDDRKAASADRVVSARDRTASHIDELTGALRRDPGLVEVEREIVRAKRTEQPFTLAFVDINDLKQRNDSHGHTAGDQLLAAAADSIQARLRSYDLIVRFGGDEFVCALPGMAPSDAAERFSLVKSDLARTHQGSIAVGLAELTPGDALSDLIAQADATMYRERKDSSGSA